jgi:hypothetical protein
MAAILYLEKFESMDGLTVYTFPLDDMEYEASQGYRVTSANVVGADYSYDFARNAPWVKDNGSESLRFTIWGTSETAAVTAWDDMTGKLRKIGRGRLYALLPDGSRRWSYAKLAGRPSYVEQPLSFYNIPVTLRFDRQSDWFSATATTGSQTITATPATWTITNSGNAPVYAVTFRLRANNSTGFTNPSLSNLTNGYSVASTRDAASANSEIKIDAGGQRILWSTDDGANYSDDYSSATLGATQVGIMRLDPGANSFRYADGGTPNLSLSWSFYPAWE